MAVKEPNGPADAERDPRLDRVYREAAREGPPAHLDSAILAAARREVGARPRPLSARLRAWRIPVSLAAVIVLSVSVVTLMREEGGEAPLSRPPATASDPAAPASARVEAEPRPAQPPTAELRRAAPERTRQAEVTRRRDEAAAQGAPAPEPGARPAPQAFQTAPSAARESVAQPQAAPAAEDRARAPLAAERAAPSVGAASGPDAARNQAPARAPQAAAKLAQVRPLWHGLEQEAAGKWLERVGELRRAGRGAEADELLAEFRRRFPGHRVPSELE